MYIVTAEPIATSSSRSHSTTVPNTMSRSRWNVARTDEGVVEPVNLLVPHVRLRANRIFDPGVSGEDAHPAVAVVHRKRLRRALDRGEQLLAIQRRHHQDASTNSMPTVRISASAFAFESAATAAVRSTSTRVVKPARAASAAVCRTQ